MEFIKSKVVYVIAFLIFVFAFSFGVFYVKNYNQNTEANKEFFFTRRTLSVSSGRAGDLEVRFISQVPGYLVQKDSVDIDIFEQSLTKLGLWPMKKKIYVGEPVDGKFVPSDIPREISPKILEVILMPVSRFEDDSKEMSDLVARRIFAQVGSDRLEKIIFLAGFWDETKSYLRIVSYVDPKFANDLNISIESLLNRVAIQSIFINFQSLPFDNRNLFNELIEKLITKDVILFKLQK